MFVALSKANSVWNKAYFTMFGFLQTLFSSWIKIYLYGKECNQKKKIPINTVKVVLAAAI